MAKSDGSQSGGGLLGGIIGGVIGFFVGGPAGAIKGFMYGSTIGGILAPPSGPDIVGPRLEDLSVQTSSNVADLPRFDGTMGLFGNMIWAKENKLQEVVTTTTKKKKLLGFTVSKVKTTTYTYYLNCAVAFALMDEDDNCRLLKVWVGDKLVYNITNDDAGTMLSSGDFEDYFTFYSGTDDQPIDPEIAADVGIANASAYPAVCYMVIHDLDLSPWMDSPGRAQIKVELSSGEIAPSDLDFWSQTPAPLHPQYVSNWNANYFDVEGMHVWKWGTEISEEAEFTDTTYAPYTPKDFDKLHYIATPGGGGFLKEKFTDIIPAEYTRNPAQASQQEMKTLRHVAKGKADINAALFVTAFVKTGAGGGGYPGDPRMFTPGTWRYQTFQPTTEAPVYFDTFYEAYQFAFTDPEWGTIYNLDLRFDPELQSSITNGNGIWIGLNWLNAPEGHVFDYPNFGIWWTDGADFPPVIPEITADMLYEGNTGFIVASLTLVMPGFHKEVMVGLGTVPVLNTHYVVYGGSLYWAYGDGDQVRVHKINIDGAVVDTDTISDVSNPVGLVRIGIINQMLVVITKIGTTPTMKISNLDDFSDFTDYDTTAIATAFGYSGQDFIDNVSMDFDKFIYYDAPNVYTKDSFDAAPVLLGDASPEFIPGEDEPDFFNLWWKGNILAVSTFGGSMPETGIQFFRLGLIAEPGYAWLEDILRKYSILAGIPDSRINTSLIHQQVRGHRVAKRGSVRNVIEQLRACWPFDIVQRGYSLWYVPRGTASVAIISHEDLGPDVQWIQDREMTPQIPWRLSLRYLDRDLEYETNEQQSQRPLDSDTEHTLEIPVVFIPDEAAQRINILHSIFLTERKTFSGFQLPPPYRFLESADVITVTFPDATYEVRLTNLKTLDNGVIVGEGKPNAVAIYTSSATGSTRSPPVQTIPVAGGSITVLMDLPHIDGADIPGIYAVMGSAFTNWTGGVLWQPVGATWEEVQGFAGNCTMGTATNKLAQHEGLLPDYGSSLTVQMNVGSLTSVDAVELYNEVFLVAYGKNGRWEIMACRYAVDNGNRNYTVTHFLRGLRGTEHNTGLHQNGDYFISLTDLDNAFLEVLEEQVGTTLTYRGVSRGADFGKSFDTVIAYEGENLTPLSPAKARAQTTDDIDDMLITITRRDRVDAGWNDLHDIPMSEDTEAYVLRIYEDNTFTTVLRTVELTGPTFLYTAAMMTADFGVIVRSLDIQVTQVSAIVGEGHPLQTTVTMTFPSAVLNALYWGLEIGQAVSSTDVGIAELYFYDLSGTPIPTTGGTAHASSEFSPTYAKANAFDGVTGNSWNSAASSFPARIYYQFASPVAVHSYKIRAVGSADAPEDFKPIYSDDNVVFNFGTQRTGEVGWSPGTQRTFTIF